MDEFGRGDIVKHVRSLNAASSDTECPVYKEVKSVT